MSDSGSLSLNREFTLAAGVPRVVLARFVVGMGGSGAVCAVFPWLPETIWCVLSPRNSRIPLQTKSDPVAGYKLVVWSDVRSGSPVGIDIIACSLSQTSSDLPVVPCAVRLPCLACRERPVDHQRSGA